MSTAETGDVVETSPEADPRAKTVLVRYFASARAAVGVDSEQVHVPASASVRDAVDALRTRHPERLGRILAAASFLLNGVAVRDFDQPVPDSAELDVLPPFAGG